MVGVWYDFSIAFLSNLSLLDHLAKTNQRETRVKRVETEVRLLSTSAGVFSKR